ncbi:MAG: VOC family protein [Caldimonas sp.]
MSRLAPAAPTLAVDHIVVAARTLAEGATWCEATLGTAPLPGGRHATMATHNLVLGLSSARYPCSYLEIIAIDPDAVPVSRPRWFDLDTPALRQAIADGPQLVHWVARTNDISAATGWLRRAGHDAGVAMAAERDSPHGRLRWTIVVRDDGRRLAGGAIPLLIEWQGVHPADALPASGVALEELRLGTVPSALAEQLGGVATSGPPGSAPALSVRLARGGRPLELVVPPSLASMPT